MTSKDLARAKSDVRGIFLSLRERVEDYARLDSDDRSHKVLDSVFNNIDKAADLLDDFPAEMKKTEEWREAAKTFYIEQINLASLLGYNHLRHTRFLYGDPRILRFF